MTLDVETILARARAASNGNAATADPAHAQQRAKLARVAQEFESMLIAQMLREMRKTESWDDGSENQDGSMGAGFGAETFNDTMDAALALHLAQAQGLGLSQQLLQAFDRMVGDRAPAQASGLTMGTIAPAMPSPTESSVGPVPLGADPASTVTPTDAEPAATGRVNGAVTSAFGWRRDPFTGEMKFHRGVDLRAAYGQDVQAAAAGTVVFSGEQRGYGTTVMIEHADGTRTRYAHLSATLVQPGQAVAAGQPVGRAGHSGRATGTHLHFEVIGPDGKAIAPSAWTAPRG
jgi:murein DD-endopeptidase MepM/ murein hydrolase activator NlpD